jgi:hypothetical protein
VPLVLPPPLSPPSPGSICLNVGHTSLNLLMLQTRYLVWGHRPCLLGTRNGAPCSSLHCLFLWQRAGKGRHTSQLNENSVWTGVTPVMGVSVQFRLRTTSCKPLLHLLINILSVVGFAFISVGLQVSVRSEPLHYGLLYSADCGTVPMWSV